MAQTTSKPALGFIGSLLLFIWGIYRLSTITYDSYVWLIPLLFTAAGAIGIVSNTIYYRRAKRSKAFEAPPK
ncbi:hypothetical protein SAMN05192534_11065 [Alteribacillus persepolensis]|uniref:Uncharacterized protein n=1 Tax=Alteribacillus persepolensis TaxID=568899 RepID=A0A1G8EU19_9BACI|nr:hypothetical protein [Alteribacillus persepolensis]SDH73317.1 hypothetical protein SAMN05192534_11065 [Alteribacillus persepolensis]